MSKHPVVKVAFLDVGQGDTIVVSLPETKEAVIVDCADANLVMNYLEHEDIQHLRGLLITHLHLDHYGGVVQFLANLEQELNINCERVFFHRPVLSQSLRDIILNDEDGHANGEADEKTQSRKRKSSVRNLLVWAKANKQRYNNLTLQPGISLPLEGIIELIHPWEADISHLSSHGLNNTSGIIKVKGANSSALLTGDIEPTGWSEINQSQLQSDVLKFPHHGAWKSDDVGQILDTVNPSTVVISVGTSGIQYSHPNKHVFEAISKLDYYAHKQHGNVLTRLEVNALNLLILSNSKLNRMHHSSSTNKVGVHVLEQPSLSSVIQSVFFNRNLNFIRIRLSSLFTKPINVIWITKLTRNLKY